MSTNLPSQTPTLHVHSLSHELYRALEDEYFDRIDEDNLVNVAEINDYWFDQDGHLVR